MKCVTTTAQNKVIHLFKLLALIHQPTNAVCKVGPQPPVILQKVALRQSQSSVPALGSQQFQFMVACSFMMCNNYLASTCFYSSNFIVGKISSGIWDIENIVIVFSWS